MSSLEVSFQDYQKAVEALRQGLDQANDDLDRDGVIQRFEFVIELSWKALQKVLLERKITAYSPRNTYREAYKEGLIEDTEKWLEYWDIRNLTVHTYREQLAQEIFEQIPQFLELATQLVQVLEKTTNEQN